MTMVSLKTNSNYFAFDVFADAIAGDESLGCLNFFCKLLAVLSPLVIRG